MEKGLSDADKKLGAFGKVAVASTAAIAAAFAAVGAAAISSADSIDKGMAKIRTGTGLTGDALEEMGGVMRDVLRTVPTDAETAGTAIADLSTRLGVSGEEAGALATQFLELSRITGTDVAGNIQSTTRIMGDWGIEAENTGDTLDYLFKISQNTGAGIDQLGRQLVQYGAPLRQMGFDFETAAVMLGKFEKEGVNTELVLGSMRIALGNLAREGVTDTNEAFSMLIDNIKNAGSTGEANLAAIDAFGARAGPDMAAAIREGRFEFENLITAVGASSDSILEAAADSMTLSDKMQILQNRVALALEPLGERLIAVFDQLMPYIEGGIDTITEWIDTITSMFDGLGTDLNSFIAIFQPFIDWHNSRVEQMAEFWEENGDLIIKALQNIGKFFQWLINDIILPLWEWAWPYISQILDDQLAVVLDVVKVFAAIFAGDWEALGDALVDLTGSVMDLMFSVISFGFDAIIGLGYRLGDIILGVFTAMWNGVLGVTEKTLNAIIDQANSVAQAAGELLGFSSAPQIQRITLQRATAPTMAEMYGEAPKLSDLTGGFKPSDAIGMLRGSAAGGGGDIIQNITINAKEIDSPSDTARAYKRAGLELATGAYGGH
jgi:TP901 family phage tail tape measure protein